MTIKGKYLPGLVTLYTLVSDKKLKM
jgi:hypothetical protein